MSVKAPPSAIGRRREIVRTHADEALGAVPARRHLAREQVHLRRTDEARDEDVRGRPIDRHRLVELLQDAVVHHRDAVRHHHRLFLIVGDEDDGDLELALQALDLGARLHPQAGVKVGERFVHEERRRMAHDGAADRDALPLAAGQFGGRAVEIGVEAKQIGGPGDLGRDRLFLGLLLAQGKGQVFAHRHMRIERVILKHERDVAVRAPRPRSCRGRRTGSGRRKFPPALRCRRAACFFRSPTGRGTTRSRRRESRDRARAGRASSHNFC